MIAIVDYGSGNIQAIKNIYKRLNIACEFVSDPAELLKAERIILPGVGAFDESMRQLAESGMQAALNECVLERKVPVLGVCVGMQIMAVRSDEGELPGLGWFDASVCKFDANNIQHKPKIPHMGWNSVQAARQHGIFQNVVGEDGFYFLHSYYFDCNDAADVLATTKYGHQFSCAVNKGNIYGFQFHPEKSHQNGINLFKNFAEVTTC